MSSSKAARKRLFARPADRITLIVIIALAAVTLIISGLDAMGLRLVQGALYIFLPMLVVLTTVGWGLSAIVRRIKKPLPRKVAVAVAVVAMVALSMLGLQYGSFVAGLTVPMQYAVMTSPDGAHRLIVMRGLDADEARINARRDARLAADPDGSQDYTAEDWGYVYTAYAVGPLGLFYRTDTLIEGDVRIGYASRGELMLDWEDGETVGHFFIKNPEPNDEGEMRVRAD